MTSVVLQMGETSENISKESNMEDLDSELEAPRSPLPATLDRVKSLQENNISSHYGSPTSPFGGESGGSHRGAPIRPGDTIRLSVNGRAVNSRSTCLISRAVICKYLVYFAVVVVYVPMVVKIFNSPGSWDEQVSISTSSGASVGSGSSQQYATDSEVVELAGQIVFGLILLPCCCCCCWHTYFPLSDDPVSVFNGADFVIERAARGDMEKAPKIHLSEKGLLMSSPSGLQLLHANPGEESTFNEDFIRYGEPVLLTLDHRSVAGEDSSGLVYRSEFLEALKYSCDGCRCMPERWSGHGSVMLHSTSVEYDGVGASDVGRRVRAGDQVFISTNQRWELGTRESRWGVRGRHYSMVDQRSFVASDMTTVPSPFRLHTSEWDYARQRGSEEDAAASPRQPRLEISLVTYNVWMMPEHLRCLGGLEVSPAKCFRARQIPEELVFAAKKQRVWGCGQWGMDVVVLNEAFCDQGRPVLLAALYKKGFIYSTGLVNRYFGSEEVGTLNSGVVIVSRHPIEAWDFLPFADAVGDDALADKGVVYAKITIKGSLVHVFSSHTQAWQEEVHIACRAKQLAQLKDFITCKQIPKNEAVIVCGDLNVNRFAADPDSHEEPIQRGPLSCTNGDSHEYTRMLEILNCVDPRKGGHVPGDTCLYSADPSANEYAKPGPSSDGEYELLDYVLVSRDHRPLALKESDAWVTLLKSKISYMHSGTEQFDLSDHFPVWSRLVFEGDDGEAEAEDSSRAQTSTNNSVNGQRAPMATPVEISREEQDRRRSMAAAEARRAASLARREAVVAMV